MDRTVLARRAAVAVAGAGLALTCAPAFAATASPAGATYVLAFTSSTFQAGDTPGSTVVGNGDVYDTAGMKAGTVVDNCGVISEVAGGADSADCTVIITLNDGDQLSVNVLGKIDPNGVGQTFIGELEGGTGVYDGVRGDAVFRTVAPAKYVVSVQPQ